MESTSSATGVGARIQMLVDEYFSRWQGPRPATPELRRRFVEQWLERECLPHRYVATALIARVAPLLVDAFSATERFVYRLDVSHIIKSPASILEKMARSWEGPVGPRVGFDNLYELKDLGRFRIVASFLSDAKAVRQSLEAPFDARRSASLTPLERSLHDEFMLSQNRFEDLIALAPGHRDSGERCFKGSFIPRRPEHSAYRIEVQIMTSFMEAWDKKEHVLVYEPRRIGLPVDPEHERAVFGWSETLYQIDLAFDRMKREIEGGPHATAP